MKRSNKDHPLLCPENEPKKVRKWQARAIWDKKRNSISVINENSSDIETYMILLAHLEGGRFEIVDVEIKKL